MIRSSDPRSPAGEITTGDPTGNAEARDEADGECPVGSFFVVPIGMPVGEVGLDGFIEDFADSYRFSSQIGGSKFECDFGVIRFQRFTVQVTGGKQVAANQLGISLESFEIDVETTDRWNLRMPMSGWSEQ